MNTTVCLVKAETGWNDVATVRSVVAVLRPAPKKKTPQVGAGPLEAWRAGLEGVVGQGGAAGKHNPHEVLRRGRILRAQQGHRRRADERKEERRRRCSYL
jgi:hypothetical protein